MKKLKAFRKSPGSLSFPVHTFLLPAAVACAFATSIAQASSPADEFWQSQGFSEILSYSNDDDFEKIEQLLHAGSPILADYSIFNAEWYAPDYIFFDWNTAGSNVLKFAYDQPAEVNPWELTQGKSMFHSDSDFTVLRDLDLRMKATNSDSQLFSIVRGQLTIDSSVTGTIFSEVSGTSVFKISNEQGVNLLIKEGKELSLNGLFAADGTGFKAGGQARIDNHGSLNINVVSGTNSGVGVHLYGSSLLHNHASGVISVNADTGLLMDSILRRTLSNEGQFVIQADSLGMGLSGNATVNNSGTLWISSNIVGIDIGSQSVVTSSGIIGITADKVLTGNGTFQVSDGSIYLNGSLDAFNGTYDQKGGLLVLDGQAKLQEGMKLEQISIIGDSSQIFNISAADWGDTYKLLKPLHRSDTTTESIKGPFSSIELMDEVVDISYIKAIHDLLPSTQIIFGGEVSDFGQKITHLTRDQYEAIRKAEATANLVLASSILHIPDGIVEGEINIGGLGTQGNFSTEITLKNGAVVNLYSRKNSFFTQTPGIRLEKGSTLVLNGPVNAPGRYGEFHRTTLDVPISVEEGASLSLTGKILTMSSAKISNEGTTTLKTGADLLMDGDYVQKNGLFATEEGTFLQAQVMDFEQGEFVSQGIVLIDRKLTLGSGTRFSFDGMTTIGQVQLNTNGLKSSINGIIGADADVTIKSISGENLNVAISSNSGTASLNIHDLNGLKNSAFSVGKNGLLTLGNDGTNEFTKISTLNMMKQLGDISSSAILVVNTSLNLSSGIEIEVGTSTQKNQSSINLGTDSILMINPLQTKPAFVSTQGEKQTITLHEGSQIFIADAFKTTVLTDENVDFVGNFSAESIKTGNVSVQLSMKEEDGRWVINRDFAKGAQASFIYPNTQTAIFENAKGLDSGNAAEEFFLRADNTGYMNEGQKDALIGQVTQLSSLLGVRQNAFYGAQRGQQQTHQAINNATTSSSVYFEVLGSVQSEKDRGGYLKDAGYRTFFGGFTAGYVSKQDSTVISPAITYSRAHSESRHAVAESKNDQNTFFGSLSVLKEFAQVNVGLTGCIGYTTAELSAHLPYTMQMGKVSARDKETFLGLSMPVQLKLTENLSLETSPTYWHFRGNTVKTKIGGKEAFVQHNESSNLIEVPVSTSVNWVFKETEQTKIETTFKVGGSVRFGDLDRKGSFSASGYKEKDHFVQKEFSRWSGFGGIEARVNRKNFNSGVGLFIQQTKYGTQGAAQVKANWSF